MPSVAVRSLLVLLISTLLLAGCAQERVEDLITRIATPVDMSGHWEVDYARSDNFQDQLNLVSRRIQREAARRAKLAEEGRGFAGGPLPGRTELITLARLAEIITEPNLLEIIQGDARVRVKRANSFALVCETDDSGLSLTTDSLGTQHCSWDGDQLFFSLQLRDGLDITHRLSLSSDAKTVLMVTAVETNGARFPLVVSQYFTRYDPSVMGYRCERSLTKGKICTTQ